MRGFSNDERAGRIVRAMALLLGAVLASAAGAQVRDGDNAPAELVSAAEPTAEELRTFAERQPRYRIRANDLIEIRFRFTPEYDQEARVHPDGFLALRDAGDLHVAEMTVAELREAVMKAYAGMLREPDVAIALKEFTKPSFVVGGAVGRPGRYELFGDVSLSDAIAVAGGFGPGADKGEVLLFRRVSPKWTEVKRVDLKSILRRGNLDEDPLLRDRDSIYVSRSKLSGVSRFLQVSQMGLLFATLRF